MPLPVFDKVMWLRECEYKRLFGSQRIQMVRNAIIQLGPQIDSAFDNQKRELLSLLIEDAEHLYSEKLNSDEIAVLDYFMGNAWSYLNTLNNYNINNVWMYEQLETINAIKFFRKCVANTSISEEIRSNIFIQAYTNLGNLFSESGRIIYAIESWNRALKIYPNFGMAGANLCHGLIYYAKILYDQSHFALFLRYSHNQLMSFLRCDDIYADAKRIFEEDLNWLRKVLNKDFLLDLEFKKYSLGRSKQEKTYRSWVLENGLYLNPLNDIYFESFIAHDILHLPSLTTTEFKAPAFHGFFNEIKQQYITARFLYYSYKNELPEDKLHYSDKDRNLIDTLDYPQYGLRYELLKNAFRSLYSIFDKIAYFINEYFKIEKDKDKVSFRNIWYVNNKQINPIFDEMNNNPLRGLYFLSKDFYAKDMDYLAVADDDAKDIAEIRNSIEHKYFRIFGLGVDANDKIRFDDLAYSISEKDFQEKTYRLLKSAREAIIYLSLAIHIEEEKNKPRDGVIMPITMIKYD